jgi:glyoxylase-like metal-dependent hydrolase (beta-lactamase superfamily II)
MTIDQVRLNPQLAVDAFRAPAPLRDKAPRPAALGTVPFQWIIRRLDNGFYLDSDALYTDDGAMLSLTDVAPNISLMTGGSHNTMIVATGDGLVFVESPGDDGLSKIALDFAKQKYPGKPVKYLILTHHHIDHMGGLRAYAAEGATIVVGKGDGAFYRKALTAPQLLNPYQTKSVAPKVIEVDGKWSVKEGGTAIEAYGLETAHATGYIIPYFPDAKVALVTDLWNPGPQVPPANAAMREVVAGIEKAGITPEKVAGGHGSVGNYADLVKSVQAAPAAAAR